MKYIFMVMDSRAQFDIDSAAILECCGDKQPSWRTLRRDWGDQGAVLVRLRLVNSDIATDPEVVGVIN
ncbi:TPA: hypothetical protein ACISY6_005178 [Salmonella enterica subsp. enterica serovar Eastbourne]|nr:hypothetical protein [Salmonella enterica subsp. enterica serovar Pomona]EGA8866130.1 hypothetical protein [Salmonella enterica subsp. enterica serovar Pomona]HEC6530947.1 hypothetical protein [Salmonella enterica subsp. enterica serovar Virchow]HEC6533899.1 hypothetical protein [Salmonella enterica subsp. enterica serovar Virchow]